MNSKNNNARKDLRLVYHQRNNTAYPTDIELAAKYLSIQYPNNKPTNQHEGNKGNQNKKEDNPKSEDKDSNAGGTASAHVEDTTTNEDTTSPRGGARLGAQKQTKHCPVNHVR